MTPWIRKLLKVAVLTVILTPAVSIIGKNIYASILQFGGILDDYFRVLFVIILPSAFIISLITSNVLVSKWGSKFISLILGAVILIVLTGVYDFFFS